MKTRLVGHWHALSWSLSSYATPSNGYSICIFYKNLWLFWRFRVGQHDLGCGISIWSIQNHVHFYLKVSKFKENFDVSWNGGLTTWKILGQFKKNNGVQKMSTIKKSSPNSIFVREKMAKFAKTSKVSMNNECIIECSQA